MTTFANDYNDFAPGALVRAHGVPARVITMLPDGTVATTYGIVPRSALAQYECADEFGGEDAACVGGALTGAQIVPLMRRLHFRACTLSAA